MNQWSKRLCLSGILILTVILAACGTSGTNAGTGGSQRASLKIMVGGLSKQIYLPNMLTKQLGYFEEQNLDVTLIDEASGQSSEDQVLAGQVDAGSGSYNHTIELQAKGKKMECVVQLDIAPGEAEVVSSKATGITTPADLKGKNLGVTERGSGTETLTRAIMQKAGVDPNSGHYVPVGAGDTFIAAMKQGKIDAGMTTEPTISRVLKDNTGKVLVDLRSPQSTQQALGGNYPFICVFMTNDYVNSHKDVVQRMVNAYVKTLKWISTHTAAEIANKMPADYYAGDKTLYVTALDNQKAIFGADGNMPSDGPPTVLGIEKQIGAVKDSDNIDLSQTYTNQFAGAAK